MFLFLIIAIMSIEGIPTRPFGRVGIPLLNASYASYLLIIIVNVFLNNLGARQGYRLTCMISDLTEQAFYAGIGTISP